MSSVQEIQRAIEKLPEGDYRKLEQWWEEYQEQHWDAKLARDSKPGGRLRDILEEVDADIDAGKVTEFREFVRQSPRVVSKVGKA